MLSSLAGLLRLVSLAICLVVIASFALFVVNQTNTASANQQKIVNGEAPSPVNPLPAGGGEAASKPKPAAPHESSLRKTVDDISNTFTSPFSGVTAGSSSEWVTRGVKLLLALALYGFGVGFLARVIRVRG